MHELLRFPNPVNEVAARVVATGAASLAIVYVLTGSPLVLAVLAYGFVARVASGPRFSPLGLLATRVVAPRLAEPKLVPGPPKRFAQGIGAVLSVTALVSHLLGAGTFATVLVAGIVVAATLEAALAFCLGCQIFALLMRVGAIPDRVCLECADITKRLSAALDTAA
jgi:hypothetical protein